MTQREKDIECFYNLLAKLEEQVDGKRKLKDCCAHMNWPMRGVYFFFENGETRADSVDDLRVVRVGTTTGNNTMLWNRLASHRSHRGISVFRDHVSRALRKRDDPSRTISIAEHRRRVSDHIRNMPFLWLKVFEKNGKYMRKFIEKNSVAMLSGYHHQVADQPSDKWLGNHINRKDDKIRRSGLWNVHYVARKYKSEFLGHLEARIEDTEPLSPCPECDWSRL